MVAEERPITAKRVATIAKRIVFGGPKKDRRLAGVLGARCGLLLSLVELWPLYFVSSK